jgi:hypothetical protein
LGEKWRRNETNIAEMFRKERKFFREVEFRQRTLGGPDTKFQG